MTFIMDSDTVYVITHLHTGIIFNTAVFSDYDTAMDYYHQLRIDCDDEFDDIDFQECHICTDSWRNDVRS